MPLLCTVITYWKYVEYTSSNCRERLNPRIKQPSFPFGCKSNILWEVWLPCNDKTHREVSISLIGTMLGMYVWSTVLYPPATFKKPWTSYHTPMRIFLFVCGGPGRTEIED